MKPAPIMKKFNEIEIKYLNCHEITDQIFIKIVNTVKKYF